MVNKVASEQELKEIGIGVPRQNLVFYYDKAGKACPEDKSVAKVVQIASEDNDDVTITYHVKHGRGQLFDPYGIDMNKTNAFDFQFKKVDKNIYDDYYKYLTTRREYYLTTARRAYINKGN
jgi:hypothetical protein